MYQAEMDDAPREVRRGFASNVQHFWPKIPGLGNVLTDPSYPPSFSIYAPDTTPIALNVGAPTVFGGQGISMTPVGTPQVTRADMMIDCSNVGIYQLAEGYRIDLTWYYQATAYLDTINFAVARAPYAAHVSLNDLVEEIADVAQIIQGQAQQIADQRTPEAHASVMGVKAWADVYMWLQARLRDQGRILPRLIIDRWKLNPVIKAQTLYRIFMAEGGTGRSKDLAEEWRERAKDRFTAMGDMTYDDLDQGKSTQTLASPIEWTCRRRW